MNMNIYIPIWCYFYFPYVYEQLFFIHIYIPIWCYFYKYHLVLIFQSYQIYIPIWCYFYFLHNCIASIVKAFTFQYGSTSTIKPKVPIAKLPNLHSNMVLLLLHLLVNFKLQLKIYIPIWCYFYKKILKTVNYAKIHLHSNMVLLLRINKSLKKIANKDLHSNMVLLLHLQLNICLILLYYLHSNMVLLLL